jgi:4-azaleucine resistance transporter AzlC
MAQNCAVHGIHWQIMPGAALLRAQKARKCRELSPILARVSPSLAPVRSRNLRDALGIGVAVGVYGISFGVLAVAAGLTPLQACVMSMLTFTGASQFAFVGVLAAGGGPLAALGPAVMLGVRNAAYGLSLAPILPGGLRRRALLAQLVIDESTAMARAQDDPAAARHAFLVTGVSVWLCWNAGTLAGAVLGGGLGDPRALGLDAMFPAAFLALLAPQLRRPGAPVAALAGVILAVALVPFTPAGVPVIAALAGVVPGVLVGQGVAAGRRRR